MNEEKLITENIGLIYTVIKELHVHETEDGFQDCYDSGLVGLINGVRTYDDTKGKISTYLCKCIKNEILKLFVVKTQKKNFNKFGKDVSLNYLISDEEIEFGELIADDRVNVEEEIEKKLESERVLNAVNSLKNETDKLVIKKMYGLDGYDQKNCLEIATEYGVSRSAINFRIHRALTNLKVYIEKHDREVFMQEKKEVKYQEVQPVNKVKKSARGSSLKDLNDILFEQLNKLNDSAGEEFEKEIRKSYAVSQIAQQIIANTNTAIKATKLAKEHDLKSSSQLKFIGLNDE